MAYVPLPETAPSMALEPGVCSATQENHSWKACHHRWGINPGPWPGMTEWQRRVADPLGFTTVQNSTRETRGALLTLQDPARSRGGPGAPGSGVDTEE